MLNTETYLDSYIDRQTRGGSDQRPGFDHVKYGNFFFGENVKYGNGT